MTRGLIATALGQWSTAAEAYERAALTDDLPQSWLGLAQARLELGEPQADVVDALEHAMRVGYQQAAVGYAAGSLYDRLGLTDEADDAYASALVALPGLAVDPVWREEPLAARFDGILAEAIARLGPAGWEVAMYAGELDLARDLAQRSPDPELANLVIDAWSRDPQAVRRLLELAGSTSRDATLHGWAALVAAREGDEEAVDRFRRLAMFNWEGAELPGQPFGIAPGTGLDGLEGIPAGTSSPSTGAGCIGATRRYDLTPARPAAPDLYGPRSSRRTTRATKATTPEREQPSCGQSRSLATTDLALSACGSRDARRSSSRNRSSLLIGSWRCSSPMACHDRRAVALG